MEELKKLAQIIIKYLHIIAPIIGVIAFFIVSALVYNDVQHDYEIDMQANSVQIGQSLYDVDKDTRKRFRLSYADENMKIYWSTANYLYYTVKNGKITKISSEYPKEKGEP